MLSVKAYKYLKGKYQQRNSARPQEESGPGEAVTPQPQGPTPHGHVQAVQQQSTVPQTLPQEVPRDSTQAGVTEPTQPKSGKTSWKWKAVLMVGLAIPVFLETLDYTVVATAQTHIASVFNRLDLQSYIGTVYLLTSTVFLPLFASFADIFGRHISLQISLFLFMVGSAISTGANNMPTMLAGRGVAGAGAAGLLAAVRIILTDSRSLDDNNWQQSILFVLYTVGYCLGPFIGGELVSVSFRWIFALNLPCSAVAMALAFFLLRGRVKAGRTVPTLPSADSEEKEEALFSKEPFFKKVLRIDWIGAALFMAGGILILLALNWGSTEKWHFVKVIVCFVVGGLLVIACLAWEYVLERKEVTATSQTFSAFYTDPMIPLALFKSLDVCVVQYATFVSGMIMLVMFYFVAIFMTIVTGLSPTKAGVQLIYFAPGMGGGSTIAILLMRSTRQPKWPIILGGVVATVALGLISMAMENNNQSQINGFMAMAGVGVGLGIGPLAVHARFSQPEDRVAIVSALTLFFRSLGGTVGLAQCGAVLNGKVNSYLTHLIKTGGLSGAEASAIAAASSSTGLSSLQSISSLPPDIQNAVRDAFKLGSKWCFLSLIPWSALAVVATLFLSNIKDRAGQATGEDAVDEKGGAVQVDKVPASGSKA